LRTPSDVAACIEGLRDGTIDCIATDHAPHAIQDKLCEFDSAAFGISGLETALGLALRALSLEEAIPALTIGPVRALGLDHHVEGLGTLSVGAPGDVVLLDPDAEWTVEPEVFASKGKNTPLAGSTLRARVNTRALTRRLRTAGVMMGAITSEETADQALARLRSVPRYGETDFVREVSTDEPYEWQAPSEPQRHIVVVDSGVKFNILRLL